jgi:hypothetical protein
VSLPYTNPLGNMKLQILRKNIVTTVVIAITLVMLLFSFIGFIFIRDLSISVKENIRRYEAADRGNVDYLNQIELKGDLSRVIKDVNYTTLLLMEYVQTGDVDKNLRREKVWQKRIVPIIDTLESHLDKSSSDFIKYNFNSIYEEINKNKLYQEKTVLNLGRDSSIVNQNLYEIRRSTEKLSESFSSFLSSKPEQNILTFEASLPLKENLLSKFVIAIFIISLIILIINLMVNNLTKPMKNLNKFVTDLKNGDFPSDMNLISEDFIILSKNLHSVRDKFIEIKDFAKVVSQNGYEGQKSLRFDREGELGLALVEMQNTLEQITLKDKERNHINQGLAKFSEILSNYTNNLEDFGDVVLRELVKFLNANQGAFYVGSIEEEEIKMVSCYAYEKKKYLDFKIKKGQGLVGQVWLEAKPIYLTEVPEKYVTITSGLGESTPRSILIVPLIFNDTVQGVIELASFQELEEYELGFIQKVTESISAALTSVKVNTKTQYLLQESSNLTNQMKYQENLMLSKVEELNLSQQETREREINYIREINRLKKKIEKYERNL